MNWVESTLAFVFVLVAMLGLGLVLIRVFDFVLRLAGDVKKASR